MYVPARLRCAFSHLQARAQRCARYGTPSNLATRLCSIRCGVHTDERACSRTLRLSRWRPYDATSPLGAHSSDIRETRSVLGSTGTKSGGREMG
ncbi:hypothetical protein BD309DRAFT_570467 [Dichomitus squalens]|uniref:Uncharacterized protein n=1 Tax=Dichomitus squalens TaxID=114155 RepID=A0A4Q9MZN1_9APHY|nr:hypothetical protein BD311DRAFT_443411 [Dichomitus squalens]TBU46830.1 hypothetical protein BD309DRAFT_570467 [Dichomitus squalens]